VAFGVVGDLVLVDSLGVHAVVLDAVTLDVVGGALPAMAGSFLPGRSPLDLALGQWLADNLHPGAVLRLPGKPQD
jgi:hypothetical protein